MSNLFTYHFEFNRALHLSHYAKIDDMKEARKAEYYKRSNAGLKGEITKLKNIIKKRKL